MFNSDRLQLICWKVVTTIVNTIKILSVCQKKSNCIDNVSRSFLSRLFSSYLIYPQKDTWTKIFKFIAWVTAVILSILNVLMAAGIGEKCKNPSNGAG